MYSDPGGHSILASVVIGFVVGAAVGGTIGGAIAYRSGKTSGLEGEDLFWATMKGIGKGALIGGALGGLAGATGGVSLLPGSGLLTPAVVSGGVAVSSGAVAVATGLGVLAGLMFAQWEPGSWPGDDPTQSPGDGFKWRGPGDVGSKYGEWYNSTTGDQLHPDLNHPFPKGPHWGWKNKIQKILMDIFKT